MTLLDVGDRLREMQEQAQKEQQEMIAQAQQQQAEASRAPPVDLAPEQQEALRVALENFDADAILANNTVSNSSSSHTVADTPKPDTSLLSDTKYQDPYPLSLAGAGGPPDDDDDKDKDSALISSIKTREQLRDLAKRGQDMRQQLLRAFERNQLRQEAIGTIQFGAGAAVDFVAAIETLPLQVTTEMAVIATTAETVVDQLLIQMSPIDTLYALENFVYDSASVSAQSQQVIERVFARSGMTEYSVQIVAAYQAIDNLRTRVYIDPTMFGDQVGSAFAVKATTAVSGKFNNQMDDATWLEYWMKKLADQPGKFVHKMIWGRTQGVDGDTAIMALLDRADETSEWLDASLTVAREFFRDAPKAELAKRRSVVDAILHASIGEARLATLFEEVAADTRVTVRVPQRFASSAITMIKLVYMYPLLDQHSRNDLL
jgi:dsDNA-binding SOS-regulon protein